MSDTDMGLNTACLQSMNEDQKIVFLQAFSKMAAIDGNFDENEKAFILAEAEYMGISPERVNEIFENSDENQIVKNASQIKNRRVALELIKELCVLAHTDEVLSDEEILFIGRIGEAMGISPQKIEEISNWVIDRIIWLEQAKLIFEES